MRNFFSYLTHYFLSKRRHGTHSPFVYTYADTVLNHYSLWNFSFSKHKRSEWTQELIHDFVHFIQPSTIIMPKTISLDYQKSVHNSISHSLTNATITIIDEWNENIDDKDLNSIIILINPHKNSYTDIQWKNMIKDSRFSLSMDLWYIGILVSSNIFKGKDHYLLK